MGERIRLAAFGAMAWLVGQWQWPLAALFTALAMLLLAPVWATVAGMAVTLVWLQLPLYMVHQFEEHYHDRFRAYFNRNVAHCEALTPQSTFWINALGVWGLNVVMMYLAVFAGPEYALGAFYLSIVNALTHLREAAMLREYNPGLWTAIALLMLFGGLGLFIVSVETAATWRDQLLGIGIAVGVHAAIIVYVVARVRKLRVSGAVGMTAV